MIDLYRERLGPGLRAEPINAFTNLAFRGLLVNLPAPERGGES